MTVDAGVAARATESPSRDEIESTTWYHTLELPGGVVTRGYFDLRPVLHKMPIPDVRGKRCLDVGTYDGFLAFELERRGAAEVVATDISDHEQWDWPARVRTRGPEGLAAIAGAEKGRGFRVARAALNSKVEKVEINVYDLSPERMGRFDVVVCGSLMLHVREPVRALEAIRSVCGSELVSSEEVSLDLSLRHRRTPVARLDGVSDLCQWWVPNVEGHKQMVRSAGFDVVEASGLYSEPFGAAHPAPPRNARVLRARALQRAFAGGEGVPHAALRAKPVI